MAKKKPRQNWIPTIPGLGQWTLAAFDHENVEQAIMVNGVAVGVVRFNPTTYAQAIAAKVVQEILDAFNEGGRIPTPIAQSAQLAGQDAAALSAVGAGIMVRVQSAILEADLRVPITSHIRSHGIRSCGMCGRLFVPDVDRFRKRLSQPGDEPRTPTRKGRVPRYCDSCGRAEKSEARRTPRPSRADEQRRSRALAQIKRALAQTPWAAGLSPQKVLKDWTILMPPIEEAQRQGRSADRLRALLDSLERRAMKADPQEQTKVKPKKRRTQPPIN